MPKASVIIATYNWSSVLPYSIASALEQSESDVEILVVGDGCTDDSEEVVGRLGDPRIRWFNLPERFGHQTGPNNEGIREARSEFIFYLGHDDLWLPHHVASYLETFEEGADLVYGISVSIPKPGDVRLATARLTPFTRGMWIPPMGLAHRRSAVLQSGLWRDYRQFNVRPEVDLVSRAVDAGYEIRFCPRLTAVKIPASYRKDVYLHKPFDEQREWLERIRSDADLEAKLLVRILARYHEEEFDRSNLDRFLSQARKRVRTVVRRWSRSSSTKAVIDQSKRLKGSDPET